MDNVTADDLLQELAAYVTPKITDGEVTVQMVVKRYGISRDSAARMLARRYANGEMTRREVVVNGGRAFAYRKVQ
jgi:hypothetical protein